MLLPVTNEGSPYWTDTAIVTEKMKSFREIGQNLLRVEGYHSSEGTIPPPPGNQIMIATIEKVSGVDFVSLYLRIYRRILLSTL